ncbi:MAG TPA: ATPase domain-containing protein, partial [Nitrososphaerales archaeon]|nr:ATPase domain-containing protein [Nitrososphaerales archaeon]
MFSTGIPELNSLLRGGYIDQTAVLIIGPVGISKEVLLYNFVKSGGSEGDLCLYITNKSKNDVVRDMKARGF